MTLVADFSEVEIGIVVNLETLRAVLKDISASGRRFWIASDPHDAAEDGSVTIGHGDPNCVDRLNTTYYRIPVLVDRDLTVPTEKLVLLWEISTVTPETPDYYVENGRVVDDSTDDFFRFYQPVERALIARLQTRN